MTWPDPALREAGEHSRLLERLHAILGEAPQGWKEFELLQRLRQEGWPSFAYTSPADELTLFRLHFLLFHLLYLLRERLRENGQGDMEIHCLGIALRPFQPNPHNLPGAPDPLGSYYLESRHLEETGAEEVGAMLESFWQQYARWEGRAEALARLELPVSASRDEIRRRFRELAKRHHPDRGGDARQFIALRAAAESLLAQEGRV